MRRALGRSEIAAASAQGIDVTLNSCVYIPWASALVRQGPGTAPALWVMISSHFKFRQTEAWPHVLGPYMGRVTPSRSFRPAIYGIMITLITRREFSLPGGSIGPHRVGFVGHSQLLGVPLLDPQFHFCKLKLGRGRGNVGSTYLREHEY